MAKRQHKINESEFSLHQNQPFRMDAAVPPHSDRLLEANCELQNVNQNHSSRLMRDILAFIDGSECVERGELVAAFYDVGGRRYCGCYLDPCYSKTQNRKFNRCYKRAQPAITRCLKKLEDRGLVKLLRHGRYVKRITLTPQGKTLAGAMRRTKEEPGSKQNPIETQICGRHLCGDSNGK